MCVLPMGLKADLSDFEQGKHAYESGRSIGGVYTCKTCAIWLSQSHELVRACHTEFTVSASCPSLEASNRAITFAVHGTRIMIDGNIILCRVPSISGGQ